MSFLAIQFRGDFDHLIKYLVAFGLAAVLGLVLTRVLVTLGPKLGLVDVPDSRRIHTKVTPRCGGIGVFIAFHLTCLVTYFLIWPDFHGKLDYAWWLGFFPASLLLFIVGLVDDSRGVSALFKLAGQFLAANLLYLLAGSSVGSLLGFAFPVWLDWPLTVLWCLALINAFNLIDGLDGLCAGLALISGVGLCLFYGFQGKPGDFLIVLPLIGVALGFLRYNFHPARIFLGDTGSMFLGFSLAAMSLEAGGKSTLLVSIAIPLVAAGVPLMDTMLAVWRRSARRALAAGPGCKVMGADREHLHHRLLDMGFNQRRVALMLYGGNIFLIGVGLLSIFKAEAALGFLILAFLLGSYVLIRHVASIELWDTGRLLVQGLKRPRKSALVSLAFPVFDFGWLLFSFLLSSLLVSALVGDPFRLRAVLFEMPFWLTPTFAGLVFAKIYSRVWIYANFRDFLSLAIGFYGGLFVALGVISVVDGTLTLAQVVRAIAFGFLGQTGILLIRSLNHVVREWLITAVYEERAGNVERTNVLLYGAGDRGSLYLRDYRFIHPEKIEKTRIVGFVDDDPNLRNRRIHGMKVLGTSGELADLVQEHRIHEVIILCRIEEEAAEGLFALASAAGFVVKVWDRNERVVRTG